MTSSTLALAWEIFQRGRRSALLAAGCVLACALANILVVGRLPESRQQDFFPFFILLMALSFLLLLSVFDYTEFNSTREWHGFPYRLFTLPVPTWKLVALPMGLAVVSVEIEYWAWITLVWTRVHVPMAGWFAVVVGTYVVFYQTIVWCLARFRITRVVVVALGGMVGVAVACLPFGRDSSPAVTEAFSAMLVGLAGIGFVAAWIAVGRQRCGGGGRRNWFKTVLGRIADVIPRRSKDFASPAAAQFWFEWRRSGWLLPACTALVIVAVVLPFSWYKRGDPRFAGYLFGRLICTPIVLAFLVGKGFAKCEFWGKNLSITPFAAVRPIRADEFVAAKLKVAAVGVGITWLLVLVFAALWLTLWADTHSLKNSLAGLRAFYPHSWYGIHILLLAALMVMTWRCMVSGLWAGLTGKPWYYFGSMGLQVVALAGLLLAAAVWPDAIDHAFQSHRDTAVPIAVNGIGFVLAAAVIAKVWTAAVAWGKADARRARQYITIWAGGTLGCVILALLASPPYDTYRLRHLFLLLALLVFPLARLGIAPLSLAKNRNHA